MHRYLRIGSRLALVAVVASLTLAPASAWFQPMAPETYRNGDAAGYFSWAVDEALAILGNDVASAPTTPPMITRIAAPAAAAGGTGAAAAGTGAAAAGTGAGAAGTGAAGAAGTGGTGSGHAPPTFHGGPGHAPIGAGVGVPDPLAAPSQQAQATIAACGADVAPCVADALEKYADALQAIAPDLPPRLRVLPSIVRRAAHRVRAARNPEQAADAVAQAIDEVNKTIALLRAENPDAAHVGAQVGRDVDRTLVVAEVKLLRASSL